MTAYTLPDDDVAFTETPEWEPKIYLAPQAAFAVGDAYTTPENLDSDSNNPVGNYNLPHQQHAKRAQYLKAKTTALESINASTTVTVFSTAGSHTFTPSVTRAYTISLAGGGAGGSGGALGGAGSGGGTTKGKLLLTAGTNYTVVIGAGGAGSNGGTSGAGGTSTFASSLTATGGASTPAGSQPGAPGIGSGGYLNLRGGRGQDANTGPEDCHGGDCPLFGLGGDGNGNTPAGPGAGGGAGSTSGIGYAGGDGICVIE